MKESSIGTLAVIALLTCAIYLVFTGFSGPNLENTQGYYGKGARPTSSNAIDHPAFITFFPNS